MYFIRNFIQVTYIHTDKIQILKWWLYYCYYSYYCLRIQEQIEILVQRKTKAVLFNESVVLWLWL